MEITDRLRRWGQDLAVVAMTGHGSLELAIKARSCGVDEFILKPFTLQTLHLTLTRAL